MPLSAAEKQRQYRKRKKKLEFLTDSWFVNRVLGEVKEWSNAEEFPELFSDVYDAGGPVLVERFSVLILEVAVLKNSLDRRW